MEYLKEAAMEYPHQVLDIHVRSWGVYVTMKGTGFTADHAFCWDELEQSRFNPITNWVEYIEGSL